MAKAYKTSELTESEKQHWSDKIIISLPEAPTYIRPTVVSMYRTFQPRDTSPSVAAVTQPRDTSLSVAAVTQPRDTLRHILKLTAARS